jgi:SAM-dependent methyltransferase
MNGLNLYINDVCLNQNNARNYNTSAMKILNLGCGTKVSELKEIVNIDWSIYLHLKNNLLLKPLLPFVFKGERLEKINSLPDNIVVHNLASGIPFSDNSVDAVYHSHILEHLDPNIAESFLREVFRVLKPNGIIRIVVPDLERICQDYLSHLNTCDENPHEIDRHDSYIASIIEQSVRREASGTSQQKPLRRFIENIILGDARKRGETHQWMYDRVNIKLLLEKIGYQDIIIQNYTTSLIPNWSNYKLDLDEYGGQYKPNSLYVESIKPSS